MSKKAGIITAFNYLKLANEYFLDFIRENKGGIGEQIIKKYIKKIEWIYFDFISIPQFTEKVRNGLREEWQSDALLIPAINEKIELLNPQQRESIEEIIDAMLNGEEVFIKETNPTSY